MTPRVDLKELADRESEQIEWKENVADVDDVVATIAAFANDLQNLGGGYVVCGAKEEKDAEGFPRLVRAGLTANRLKEVENVVLARCRDRVSPPITPLVEELLTDDVARRILVFVQPATDSAHTFRRGHEGAKHFVRVSRSTIEARNGLLRNLLVRKGARAPWDRRPCSGATVGDLDLLAIRDALQRIDVYTPDRGVEPYLVEGAQITPFVPSLCIAEPLTGVLRPRNYAILLFGRDPQRFIPGAFAIYSAYPGLDRTDPFARRSEIAGTLLEQARRLQELLDSEVVTLFDKTDLKAPNAQKYPRRALQEAMVNALAHRDYELVDPSRFTSFRDRIEFVSPGALPFGVTIQELRKSSVTPRWRNQSLAWFLSRMHLAQAEGQGIQTMRSTMKAVGCPPPRFTATVVSVSCVLRAHPRSSAMGVTATGRTQRTTAKPIRKASKKGSKRG
ncbi:MAG: putative DNA binding domain-containing protein [Deltaproteobacteria bacterium]|nr:putative DNA binding domain-containing protein [Deltaproteobacteria bacterium]